MLLLAEEMSIAAQAISKLLIERPDLADMLSTNYLVITAVCGIAGDTGISLPDSD